MDEIRQLSEEMIAEETSSVLKRKEESRLSGNVTRVAFTLATVVDLLLVGIVATVIEEAWR